MACYKLGKLNLPATLAAVAGLGLVIQYARIQSLREQNAALLRRVEVLSPVVSQIAILSNRLEGFSASQSLETEPPRDVLKLRGEIGVLRRQVAELTRPSMTQVTQVTQGLQSDREMKAAEELELAQSASDMVAPHEEQLNSLKVTLADYQEKVNAGKRSLDKVFNDLNLPQDVAAIDVEAGLKYFRTKSDCEELQRFLDILKAKIASEAGSQTVDGGSP